MSYNGIFPDSTEFPVPLYPIIALLVCSGLYAALFQFTLQKIIQNLFALSTSFGHVERTAIYLLIINFPALLLGITCLVYNHSLIGFFINIDIDLFQTLLVSGYICFVEESRQTPLCGFLFIRDILLVLGFLGSMLKIYYDGKPDIAFGFILLALYFVYYITQLFEEQLEDSTLRLLKLKDADDFNSTYLLTQARMQADYLGIRQIIEENKNKVNQDIEQFQLILNNTVQIQDQRLILVNFSKLFLPYITANKIKEENLIKQYEEIFNQQSMEEENSQDFDNPDSYSQDDKQRDIYMDGEKSSMEILNGKTLTEDFIIEDDNVIKQSSNYQTILKYAFYPIYLISFVTGRPRYLLDFISLLLMAGCMWVIGNSSYYFVSKTDNKCYLFVSIIVTLLVTVPSSQYYLKISQSHGFDFINMFLQSAILKTVIFGVAVTIIAFINADFICYGSLGLMISVAIGLITFLVYGILISVQKFATLKSNFPIVITIIVITYILRLTVELTLNLMVK